MKVVILCGGQGTRIRGVDDDVPKPMIPIGRFPILWHIMKYYATWDYRDFILCLGHKGNAIKDFFLSYESRTTDFTLTLGKDKSVAYHGEHEEVGWRVTFADTSLEAMTGARVKRIQKYVGRDDHFMLTYGDGVSNVDLMALLDFHMSHGKVMTVTGVRPLGRFGELASDADGRVVEFNEKPQATGGRISGGYFVCQRRIFDYLDDRQDLVLEDEPMRALVRDGEMMTYEHDGFWQCMDTYRDYRLLSTLWEEGRADWKKW